MGTEYVKTDDAVVETFKNEISMDEKIYEDVEKRVPSDKLYRTVTVSSVFVDTENESIQKN